VVLLRPLVERSQERRLDHRSEPRDDDRAGRQQEEHAGEAEIVAECGAGGAADGPCGDIGAECIEAAMRHIHDPHDAVNEAQAGGDQEENRGVEKGIEDLDDENRHGLPPCELAALATVGFFAALKTLAPCVTSDRAGLRSRMFSCQD
jgi:hypothetical protein